jgi:hypothetical protein
MTTPGQRGSIQSPGNCSVFVKTLTKAAASRIFLESRRRPCAMADWRLLGNGSLCPRRACIAGGGGL